VKESKDRVTTAIDNSGYRWARGRMTINLAPANVKKEGPSFDLPSRWASSQLRRRRRFLVAPSFVLSANWL
jgi:predicted ATPase with chaperone activity